MHAIVYETHRNYSKTHRIMGAVAEGLKRHQYTVEVRESSAYPEGNEQEADLLAIWGDYHGTEHIYADRFDLPQLLHIDNGYLSRGHYAGYYSVTYGQKQVGYDLWKHDPPPPDRWLSLHETVHPWRAPGTHVLTLGLSRKQCDNLGFAYPQYNLDLAEAVTKKTHRPIVFREKRYDRTETPLREVLQTGSWWAAVGYNTKGLVEALLEGIPVFALDECAVQALSGRWDMPTPTLLYPARRDFFTRLAYHQWTLAEIAAGHPWQKGCPLRVIGGIT